MDPALSPAPGLTLGHYRLSERIGAGGMGEVWRARDERLERDVALKVLLPGMIADDGARKRFRREALALSKLNHPHIATVFDFDREAGLDFLVMEHVSGVTLAAHCGEGALPETEVVRLGLQLAEGLAAAHGEGIVHRDLKPANLRLTSDGRLKILDFGLAHLAQAAGESEVGSAAETRPAALTKSGAVIGTLGYTAPEQLRGEKVDARTDLWAAGLVLYELATGKRAYEDTGTVQVMHAILNESPAPPRKVNPNVSSALEAIILKCVEKEPAHRYASARELAEDLTRLQAGQSVAAERTRQRAQRLRMLAVAGPAAVAAIVVALVALNVGGLRARLFAPPLIRSIAVLPLANLSGDPDQEYLADGMTEQLINDLGQVGSLRIISRTSAIRYKDTKKGLPEIAKELNVDAVVEGSVVRAGDRVRISAQLINASKDRQLWAQSYERELRDVLILQGEVARAIVAEVRANLTADQATRLASARPVDPEAQEAYLRGRHFLNHATEQEARMAIDYFEKALASDPRMARAYAGLAEAYQWLGTGGADVIPPRESYEKARTAALKALELDDNVSEAHMVLGNVYWNYDFDFAKAEREYERAIELDPNNGMALMVYGQLVEQTRHDPVRAVALTEHAVEVDPLTPIIRANLVFRYFGAGRIDQAEAEARRALAINPNDWVTHWCFAGVYDTKKRYADAIAELQRASDLSGENPMILGGLAYDLIKVGRRADAIAILRDCERRRKEKRVPPSTMMSIYNALGETDSAFAWAERTFDEGSGIMIPYEGNPEFRSDPRFKDLMRRMHLPTE